MTLDKRLLASLVRWERRSIHFGDEDCPAVGTVLDERARRAQRVDARAMVTAILDSLSPEDQRIYGHIARARAVEAEWLAYAAQIGGDR